MDDLRKCKLGTRCGYEKDKVNEEQGYGRIHERNDSRMYFN
jgi:hypothetical protein